jgi:hypothetical protein
LPFTKHLIALTPDRKRIGVLVRWAQSQVVLVDVQSGSVVDRRVLPGGLVYEALDIGPISGRVYVLASREVGPNRGPTKGPPADAVVTVLARDLTPLVVSQTVRTSAGFNWFVLQGTLDPSESHLLISYHGPDTSGLDMVAIEGDRLVNPCTQPGITCIQSHGGFATRGDRLFLATGGARIIEADAAGKTLREIDTGIENEHVMEFALDSAGSHLFIAGSCNYSRGLFVVDLSTLKTKVLAEQRSETCGERVLVVGESRLVVFDPDILVVDASTGQLQIRRSTGLDPPVDGLVPSTATREHLHAARPGS